MTLFYFLFPVARKDVGDIPNDGSKIVFRKPARGHGNEKVNVHRKLKSNDKASKRSAKAVQNKSLLSFDDGVNEEQDETDTM